MSPETVQLIYFIGFIPSFLLMFRTFYIMDAREACQYRTTDTELASYAVLKAAACTILWPLFLILVVFILSIVWTGKLLKRMMRL